MSKYLLSIAAASLASLVSCFPPAYPPQSRYQSDPDLAPRPDAPYDGQADVTPPPSPTPPGPPSAPGGYPTAQRTANPDEVLSPYEPYNVIDVAGFKSGQLARDPSNQKIFRIP